MSISNCLMLGFAVLVALFPLGSAGAQVPEGLSASLSVPARTYAVGQEVPLVLTLQHAGMENADVSGWLYSLVSAKLRVTVTDQATGKPVTAGLRWSGPGQGGRRVTLKTGERLAQRFDLTQLYPDLAAGAYKVTMGYRSGNAWLVSNATAFTVLAPQPALQARVKALSSIQKMSVGAARTAALQRFVDRHRGTSHEFRASRELAFAHYVGGDLDKALSQMASLLAQRLSHPRDRLVRWQYARVLFERGNRKQAIEHMSVIGDYQAENLIASWSK